MALSVLGPVRLNGPGGIVEIPGRKTREVLTLLALAAPRPLSAGALASAIWDQPPPSALKTVQAHVSRVRSALTLAAPLAGELVGGSHGYGLVATEEALDVHAVDGLRRRARLRTLAGDDAAAVALLNHARSRWRGEPELPLTRTGEAERARLTEQHLQLVEDHLAALIASGEAADAVAELEALGVAYPVRERTWALLMRALYQCGRQTEALETYRVVRERLMVEVGVDPGPELRATQRGVLEHSLATPHPTVRPVVSPVTADVPRYAATGGGHVAYGVFGDGPVDVLMLNPTFIPIDAYLEQPVIARAIGMLADGRRVIGYDRHGLGLSDPVDTPTVDQWVEDAIAVLDAADMPRVHVLANADTSLVALPLAARHPGRIASLTLVNGYARFTAAPEYPYGMPSPQMAEVLRSIHTPGAQPARDVLEWRIPSVAADARFREWWEAIGRRGASPRTAAHMHDLIVTADVRDSLPHVLNPVLLLPRTGCASYDPGHARYLAAHLPDATLVQHDDPNDPWFIGDVEWTIGQFSAFVRDHT